MNALVEGADVELPDDTLRSEYAKIARDYVLKHIDEVLSISAFPMPRSEYVKALAIIRAAVVREIPD